MMAILRTSDESSLVSCPGGLIRGRERFWADIEEMEENVHNRGLHFKDFFSSKQVGTHWSRSWA